MNPQLLQSIQLMALPIQELKFRIFEEVERNPALEMVEDRSEVQLEEPTDRVSTDIDLYYDQSYTPQASEEAAERNRRFLEGVLTRPESLQEHLMWQLRLQPIDRKHFSIGELLIQNLDENGFHIDLPETFFTKDENKIAKRMIEIINTFEPVGCCSKDYRESLLVQARLLQEVPEGLEVLISNYFELLERGKTGEVAKMMKVSVNKIESLLEYLKTLNPFPGREYSTEKTRYVIPDLQVKMKDGEFVLILNDEEIPVLGINPFFSTIAKEKKPKKQVQQFVSSRIKDAKWFIRGINQRNATLLKIANAIIEFQRDFFLKGPKYLAPLTQKDIAQEVNVHETTVSRIATSKYIQTEWGIFEIKYFFSNSISGAGSGGSRYSKEAVKIRIKEIIEEEGGQRHLSDQKISDILKNRGINLARRTVAKYRKELDISPSYDR